MKQGELPVAILISIGIVFLIFTGFEMHPNDVQSKKLIRPDIEIKIKNGISDTTFIYKLK